MFCYSVRAFQPKPAEIIWQERLNRNKHISFIRRLKRLFSVNNSLEERAMKCPGQDSRYWKPGAIFDVKCPNCGEMIEFFKDDTRRRCPGCGAEVPNPEMDFGCAAYCPYAEHCLGGIAAEKAGDSKLKIMKASLAKALRSIFLNDSRKVSGATSLMELCEEIGKKEGADLGIVLIAGLATLSIEQENSTEEPRKASDDLLKKLTETGVGEKLARDSLVLAQNAMSGKLEDEKEIKNYNVIKDAIMISRFQSEGRSDWESLSKVLVTDSARQMAASRAALRD